MLSDVGDVQKTDLPQPGETLAGKYAIVRVIGEGGMGVVYEAMHLRLRQRVAIKMLLPILYKQADIMQRFEREGRMAAQLRGQHVAKVLDVDALPSGVPYIVMEYLEGRDLDAELGQRGSLPIAEAVDYVLQACDAMREAHELGIVHRDLKPANLFLCPGTSGTVVKVLDFGISKSKGDEDAKLTGTHATVGTPLYMSPEQVRSAKNVDLRTDIWSLGVILFELLTGRPPFTGSTTGAAASIVMDPPPSLRELRVEIPAALEAAIMRALEKDPARRYAEVQSFAQAIAPYGATFVPQPAQPSVHPTSVPPVSSGDTREKKHSASQETLARAATVSHDGSVDPAIEGSLDPAMGRSPPRANPATSPGWTRPGPTAPSKRRTVAIAAVAAAVVLVVVGVGLRFASSPGGATPPLAPAVDSISPPLPSEMASSPRPSPSPTEAVAASTTGPTPTPTESAPAVTSPATATPLRTPPHKAASAPARPSATNRPAPPAGTSRPIFLP
jgi:serine/threonine-protein kinase